MGEPVLEPSKIPVLSDKKIFVSETVEIGAEKYSVTSVSMGNPHAVTYVTDVQIFLLKQ
jgi:diaminopimelate epimerase